MQITGTGRGFICLFCFVRCCITKVYLITCRQVRLSGEIGPPLGEGNTYWSLVFRFCSRRTSPAKSCRCSALHGGRCNRDRSGGWIVYPVCRLCRDHERSGFVEGIKIGILLQAELTEIYIGLLHHPVTIG